MDDHTDATRPGLTATDEPHCERCGRETTWNYFEDNDGLCPGCVAAAPNEPEDGEPTSEAEVDQGHEIEIQRVLVLSTAHLTEDTARRFDHDDDDDDRNPAASPALVFDAIDCGYLIWINSDPTAEERESIPAELIAAMALGRKYEATYLRFDCDGPVINALPVHEW